MSSTHDPSIEELRARSELSRAALTVNVAELRGRIARLTSPAEIRSEVRNYVRSERDGFLDNLRARAADNPLQAAAVAAAVAYPALSLARAIPVPLMLIGAGLFLTTKRGMKSSAAMKAKMNDAGRRVTDTVTDMTETVTSRVSDTVSGLRDQTASAAGHGSAEPAGSVATLGEETEAVTAKLANMASETVQEISSRASRARGSATRFASDNAVLLAGVGVIAGALLAASFPTTRTENRVLGPGKRKVKDAARAAAAKGMDKAGAVVADVVESVGSAAAREGLDGAGLQQAVGDLTGKARAVAERSVDAALGQGAQGHQGQERQGYHQQEQQSFSERNPS